MRPIWNESVEQVRDGVPLDIIDIMGLAVAVVPTLAMIYVFLPYAIS
jgi:hypothetical protein